MKFLRIPDDLRVALSFAVFAAAWILVTDKVLSPFAGNPVLMSQLASGRDAAFVVITAILLFVERRHSDAHLRESATQHEHLATIERDITDRALALEEIQTIHERLKAIIDASPLAIFALDVNARVTLWSPAAERLFGWRTDEALGRQYPLVPPEGWDEFWRHFSGLIQGRQHAEFDARRQKKDGSWVDVRMSTAPLLDRNGNIAGGMVIAADQTERKQNEELARIQQQKLIQADKMASLGLLVSGIAHEINNPNNYILLNAKILRRAWNDLTPILKAHFDASGDFSLAGMPFSGAHDRISQLVTAMGDGAQRIQRIIESLKDFARKDSGELAQQVDLNRVIRSALVILSELVRKSTECFSITYAPDLPPVRGNAQQLEQVIVNLITNSCQALSTHHDELTISTDYDIHARCVAVRVCDGGAGIRAEHIPLIMDPFFTTKRDQGGTGLGLAISYRIVKNHGGDLKIESEFGRGTRAVLTLPACPRTDPPVSQVTA